MNLDIENMETPITTLAYEQPNLKKYGTMKGLTEASAGSRGDSIQGANNVGRSENQNRVRDAFSIPLLGEFGDETDRVADPDGGIIGGSNRNDSAVD